MRICDNEPIRIDYVNGELGRIRRILYTWHLARCPGCRTTIRELAEVSSAVRAMPRQEVPPALVARTKVALSTIHPAVAPAPRRIGWLLEAWEQPRVVAAAALTIAAGLGFVVAHLSGHLKTLLASATSLDLWWLLLGASSQADTTLTVPVGLILLMATVVAIPSLIDNAFALALHRAIVRAYALGEKGAVNAAH